MVAKGRIWLLEKRLRLVGYRRGLLCRKGRMWLLGAVTEVVFEE